jgi:hypothetical protein
MADLAQQISDLEDIEAIEAMDYVARWVQYEVQREGKIPAEILDEIGDEQAATEILSEMFPELSGPLQETLAADESQRGRIARNYLLFLAEDERYAPKVKGALDRPVNKELLATMAGAAAIYFLLGLEFELEYEKRGDEWRKKLRISRKSAPLDMIEVVKRILGL